MIIQGTAVGIRSFENKCGLDVATPKKKKKKKEREEASPGSCTCSTSLEPRALLCLVLTPALSSPSNTLTRPAPMSALGQSRQVLEILSKSLGFVPVVGENLKSAFELASKICEEIEVRGGLDIIFDPLSQYSRVPVDHPGESRKLQAPRGANQRSPPHHLGHRRSGEGSRGEARRKEATRREPTKVRLRIIRQDIPPVNTSRRSGCLKRSRLPFASVFLLILPRPKDQAAFSPP
jgi:hypothetical protein